VRTTIDLPEDLHRITTAIARDQGSSLSETVAQLLRRAIGTPGTAHVAASGRTGLQVIRLGRAVTTDDVRALDDEP
jgi:Arc/MetJ family transcription regulator